MAIVPTLVHFGLPAKSVKLAKPTTQTKKNYFGNRGIFESHENRFSKKSAKRYRTHAYVHNGCGPRNDDLHLIDLMS